MTRLDAVRERYLKDGPEIRLGGLAANLARLASFSGQLKKHKSIEYLLEESKWFIEWTIRDTQPEIQAELVELQIKLAVWQRAISQGRMDEDRLREMISQASSWSKHLLERSGLLKADAL